MGHALRLGKAGGLGCFAAGTRDPGVPPNDPIGPRPASVRFGPSHPVGLDHPPVRDFVARSDDHGIALFQAVDHFDPLPVVFAGLDPGSDRPPVVDAIACGVAAVAPVAGERGDGVSLF